MSDQVCGYRNYDTFTVAMFLSNDRVRYERASEFARQALAMPEGVTADLWLSGVLQTFVEEECLLICVREGRCRTDAVTPAHELMMAALARVDWRRIAEEWLTKAREDQEAEAIMDRLRK